MTMYWPGTKTPKSTNNAFDRVGRGPSIFYDPKKPPPAPSKGHAASVVPTVQGLSKQAQAQLSHAPKSISISPPSDRAKTAKVKRAAI